MKLQRTVRSTPQLFHLVPLVNVLFLLAAFVTLGSSFVSPPGLSVALPFSPFTLEPEQGARVVRLVAGPMPTLYFYDRRVTLEEFDVLLQKEGGKERSLLLHADKSVPFEAVARVVNLGVERGYRVNLAASGAPE